MASRNNNGNYQIVLATKLDVNGIKTDIKKLSETLPAIRINVQINEKSAERLKQINELLSQTSVINQYVKGLNDVVQILRLHEREAGKVVTATKNMSNAMDKLKNATTNVVSSSKNLVNTTENVRVSYNRASQSVKTFGDRVKDAFQKFSLWSVVSGVFYQIINAAKGLIDTAIELDRSFTELSKVTNLTIDDFDRLTSQAYELGSATAKTTKEVIDAMTEFSKAGYSVEESTGILAKNALMWTNVADGTIDASESANMMIAVMKAFNMQAVDTTHIIDAMNKVSNNFAVSSGDLSNSIMKSAAVLANAGVTFEEQLGLLTAGTEVIRNASQVSNALRTISLRLQGMEEDGSRVDGMVAKMEDSFQNLGLTLYDTEGNLKNTYEILKDLSEVYPSLSTGQKAFYTEMIAGKTRANVAAAVLNNFSTAIKATETAYDSAGSAADENAKVLDSLNGHIQKLKSEWESLVNSKATQDFLKFWVDLGTNIVKVINALGGMKTVLMALFGVLTIAKISPVIGGFKNLADNIYLTYLYAKDLTLATDTLAVKTQALGVASQYLGTQSIFLLGKLALIAAAIMLIVKVADSLIVTYKEQAEIVRNLASDLDETKQKLKDVNDAIKANEEEIIEINKNSLDIIDEKTLDTLRKENSELQIQKKVLEEIAAQQQKSLASETYKKLFKRIETSENNSPATGVGFSSAAGVLMNAGVYEDVYNDAQKFSTNDNIRKVYQYQEAIKILKGQLESLNTAYSNGKITVKDYEAQQKVLSENMDYYEDQVSQIVSVLLEDKGALDDTIPAQKQLIDDIDKLNERYIEFSVVGKTFEDVFNSMTSAQKKQLRELVNTGKLTASEFQKDFPVITLMFKGLGLSIDDVITKITTLLNTTKEVADDNSVQQKIAEVHTQIKTASDAYKDLSAAVKEHNETGKISVDTMSSLLKDYPKYLDVLEAEGYSIDVINKLLAKEIELKISDAESENQAALEAVFGTGVKYDEAKARLDNAKAIYEEVKALRELTGFIGPDNTEQKLKEQEKALKQYEDNQKRIELLKQSLKNGFSSGKNTGSSSTKDAWKEEFETFYKELKNFRDRDLITDQEYYDRLNALNEKYFANRTKYAAEYEKYQLELYKLEKTLLDKHISDLEHAYKMLENQGASSDVLIAKQKEIQEAIHNAAEYYRDKNLEGAQDIIDKYSEAWWEHQKVIDKVIEDEKKKAETAVKDLEKVIKDATNDLKDKFDAIRDVAVDTIENEINTLQDQLDAENDLIDAQIDKYKEEKEQLGDQKTLQEKLLKIEEARKKLTEARSKKVRVYREGRGFVYETDFDAVNSAQQELDSLIDDWNLFQEKANIDKIIEQLEAEKDSNKKRVNEQIKDLKNLKDAWKDSLDLKDNVEDYKGWLAKIKESESESYDERLEAVKKFAKAYAQEMQLIKNAQSVQEVNAITDGKYSTSTYTPTQKSYNGVTYSPDTDYAALIEKAEKSGAPADYLVSLEKKRNAKIDGEGITDYYKTYNYTSPPSTSSSGRSSSTSSHSPVSNTGSGSRSSDSVSMSSSSSGSSSSGSLLSKITNAIKNLAGYASGTTNADGMLHFVGESGPELYIPPKGSSIIPSNLTGNLMAWGAVNPMSLVAGLKGGGDTVINVNNISLPNVKDGNSFIEELKNFKGFAVQKQSVRR